MTATWSSSGWTKKVGAAYAAVLFATCALAVASGAQEVEGERVRYDRERAVVYFEKDQLTAVEMERFSQLVDRGIGDIGAYLGTRTPLAVSPQNRIRFYVSTRVGMSRAFRSTVLLPIDRVKSDSAPYLHETTHVLAPVRSECLWLAEGFASFVQSYVSENMGGYDGYVFSRGGNRSVDRLARDYLASERGKAVLPYVGTGGTPPEIWSERRRVAAPFYVLSHSFCKFLVERAGLATVKGLLTATDVGAALQAGTGRSTDEWKRAWLAALEAPSVSGGD